MTKVKCSKPGLRKYNSGTFLKTPVSNIIVLRSRPRTPSSHPLNQTRASRPPGTCSPESSISSRVRGAFRHGAPTNPSLPPQHPLPASLSPDTLLTELILSCMAAAACKLKSWPQMTLVFLPASCTCSRRHFAILSIKRADRATLSLRRHGIEDTGLLAGRRDGPTSFARCGNTEQSAGSRHIIPYILVTVEEK